MARSGAVVGLLLAAAAFGSCFLGGVPTQPPRAPTTQNHVDSLGAAPAQSESSESYSWAAPLLSFGAALGVIFGLVAAQPAKAITAEQFSQLTYAQVRGSGLANRCPTVESNGTEVPVKAGSKMINVCFEPKSFAVEIDTDNGKEFATTKLTTRQTYTLAFIEGNLDPNPITFKEQDGMDFAATTVKLPDGEYVPFLFTVKELVAKGEGSSFKPGFTWGGEFSVPSYRTGGFLDPKARGMNLGYDQAVALPAMQADGKSGQEDIFKETNKVFDVGRGAIEMEVNKAGPKGVHQFLAGLPVDVNSVVTSCQLLDHSINFTFAIFASPLFHLFGDTFSICFVPVNSWPFFSPCRWTKSWARLAVSLSPSNLLTPTWAPKSQRLTGGLLGERMWDGDRTVRFLVIQAVTFWFPIVGGHLTPLKGHLTISKRSQRIARFWMFLLLSCLPAFLYSFSMDMGPRGHESLLENVQAVKSKQPKRSSLELGRVFFCFGGTFFLEVSGSGRTFVDLFFFRRARTVLLKGIFYGKVVNAWEADSSTLAPLLRFRWKKKLQKTKRWGIWRKLICSGKSWENGVLFVWFHCAGFEEIKMKNTHPFLVLTVNQ